MLTRRHSDAADGEACNCNYEQPQFKWLNKCPVRAEMHCKRQHERQHVVTLESPLRFEISESPWIDKQSTYSMRRERFERFHIHIHDLPPNSPLINGNFNEKRPDDGRKRYGDEFPHFRLVDDRQQLYERLKCEYFIVEISVGEHVVAHDMRDAPLAMIQAWQIEAKHSPAVTLMDEIVCCWGEQSERQTSDDSDNDTVEHCRQYRQQECRSEQDVNGRLELDGDWMKSLTRWVTHNKIKLRENMLFVFYIWKSLTFTPVHRWQIVGNFWLQTLIEPIVCECDTRISRSLSFPYVEIAQQESRFATDMVRLEQFGDVGALC